MAGFIGMPPMNFFDGFVKQRDGREIFVEGVRSGNDVPSAEAGFEIPLPPSLMDNIDKLNGQPDRQVVLGIRPEHFLACPSESSAPIKLRLNVIEPLGGDMDLYANTRFHEHVVARIPAQSDLQVQIHRSRSMPICGKFISSHPAKPASTYVGRANWPMPRDSANTPRLDAFIQQALPSILNAVNPARAIEMAAAIVENDRWNSFDRWHETSRRLKAAYDACGATGEITSIPTGGVRGTGKWIIPEAADIVEGTLDLIEPVAKRLADYRQCPWHVVQWSAATPREGIRCEAGCHRQPGAA